MTNSPVYKVLFVNQGQSYEIYAKEVQQSSIYGFIEVEELLFGERSKMLVDPAEEKLKSEFEGVNKSLIPVHAVIRIDQVKAQGVAKISEIKGGSVTAFPMPPKPGQKD